MTGGVWRKAKASGSDGGCVEVEVVSKARVRDSKDPFGPELAAPGLPVLLRMLKNGHPLG